MLLEINKNTGITIIIVTHQMEVVRKACERACILEQGVITAEGPVEEIFFNKPDSLLRLLGEERRELPPDGHNIQIGHQLDRIEDGLLLNEMALELNYAFPIIDGQILEYRGSNLGMFTINVDSEHLEAVKRYLDDRGLEWRELCCEHDTSATHMFSDHQEG